MGKDGFVLKCSLPQSKYTFKQIFKPVYYQTCFLNFACLLFQYRRWVPVIQDVLFVIYCLFLHFLLLEPSEHYLLRITKKKKKNINKIFVICFWPLQWHHIFLVHILNMVGIHSDIKISKTGFKILVFQIFRKYFK